MPQCMINIFMAGGGGGGRRGGGWVGGTSEICLKWGSGDGMEVIKRSFKNILEQRVGKGESCS